MHEHFFIRRFCTRAPQRKAAALRPHTMPRYPNLTVGGLLRFCDYTGTVSFASSGALVAGVAGMDIVGCIAVGTITAIGGGTIRDVILRHQRAFWLDEHEYLWMSLVAAALTYSQYRRLRSESSREVFSTILDWTDHIGVAAFSVIGSMNAIRALGGVRLAIVPHCVIAGVMTATFGGAVRDVVTGRPVRIFYNKQSLYAVSSAVTSLTYILLSLYSTGPLAITASILTGIGLRAISMKRQITTDTMVFPDEDNYDEKK
ncbi:conserved hypothetical protein [Perkinsus marinus ATCC 50983]|uniref:Glycine transporter domain-containing protein n=1 Tax=Perkinsus marinus (strain ATCC 50983 / TXsc) TaxID=423536 RepID=C5LM49_PERM5|nr:conserved hypothetical protein [Perkinsus marinus ATCC 50983]EER02180.1 conserved hypothetical protein [Perkinsus marinus ATCC 50983]|eukprot:XP_002769462.1 conserved hypothetical protein [Perkinsus marinus ATCC 50983]